jgi:hypothetical protein
LFVRYIEICRMLGDLTESCGRGFLPSAKIFQMESMLLRWLDDMPSHLRLPAIPRAENFISRQLHLPYLMSIMIFSRFRARGVSREAVLAASSCAGIFESFLSRDEVKYLAPVFTIYCICSGFTLLTLYHDATMWSAAQADLNVILKGLSELSKSWRSAIGGLKALQSAIQAKERNRISRPPGKVDTTSTEWRIFFSYFPDHVCRLRTAYESRVAETMPQRSVDIPATTFDSRQLNEQQFDQQTPLSGHVQQIDYSLGEGVFDTGAVDLFGYDHFGSWLLNEPSIAALGGA